jgi:hypothetical protein
MHKITQEDLRISNLGEAKNRIREELKRETDVVQKTAGDISGALGATLRHRSVARAEAYRLVLCLLADVTEV